MAAGGSPRGSGRGGGESRKRRVRRQQRWHEEGDGCAAIWFPIMGRRDAPLSSEQRPGHPTPSSPSLGTMSVLVWCWCKPTQPNPPDSLSFACTSASQPSTLLLCLLLLRSPLPPLPPPLPPPPTARPRPRPHPLPSPSPFTTATATTTAAATAAAAAATAAVTPLPPSAYHPLLPTAVLYLHLLLLVFLPSFFSLPNYYPSPITALSASSERIQARISPFRSLHRCRPHFPQKSPTQANRAKF